MGKLVYGKHPILNLLHHSTRVISLHLLQDNLAIKKLAATKKIKYQIEDKIWFQQVKGNHQGICALVKPFPYSNLEQVKRGSCEQAILVLDQIQDPHNFGAIIRSAAAAHFQAIIVGSHNQVEVTPTVEKTAAGASLHIPIIKVININYALTKLKKWGFWIVGTSGQGQSDYRSLDYQGQIALVVGSEQKGIKQSTLQQCDWVCQIPLNPAVESLNVSVAAAIVMFWIWNRKNSLL